MTSKTKTTTTKEETPPALVPKLRFPEFRGAEGWKSIPLSRLANRAKQKNRDEKIDRVLTNSAEFGVVDQRDFFDKDIATQGKLEGYFVVELSSYVYNPRISSTAPVGPISKNKIGTGVMSPLYTVFKFKDDRNDFYEHFFKTTGWHTYMRQASSTGARHDRMAISSDDFMAMPLPVPSPDEQQKIAECLSSVDELMAAQARKVEALKTHKKGLMQQLFPREGETQPRLRFPEFQNAGEWVAKSLGAIAPLQRGFDLPADEIRPGNVPIVYSNGPKGFHARGMAKGPGIVTGRSGTIGKIHFIESGDYWPHNTSLWVTSFEGHIPKFVYYLYESIRFLRFASGSGVPTLNRNDAHSFATSVPPHTDEQQRIASCLSSLDALITAETQKLEALKTHKKGLMQQLFPTAEEVEA